ncbi:MAG: hypothetical protein ICV83_15550 [Cytophagales bacterium]|nr:hypothetical protein [Cytophagales bacterium]
MKKRVAYMLVVLAFALNACTPDEAPQPRLYSDPDGFAQVFDSFWTQMSSRYVYWGLDTTDWNRVYRQYQPRFRQLDIRRAADVQTSVAYFREMTAGLADGHFYVQFGAAYFPAPTSINPAFERKQKLPTYRAPSNYRSSVTRYLDVGYQSGSDVVSAPNQQVLSTLAGTIGDRILYFSCNYFYLSNAYHASKDGGNRAVIAYFFEQLAHLPVGAGGVIIDVRGNAGGALADLNFLVGRFIESPLHFGYTRYKAGRDRLEYTPWVKSFVNPVTGSQRLTRPIIVLADQFSASAAELIAQAIKTLPSGKMVGENTYGATGPLAAGEVYDAGSFRVGDFMMVQTASAAFQGLDGQSYERHGIAPDVFAPYDPASLEKGIDTQLEKAISLIP